MSYAFQVSSVPIEYLQEVPAEGGTGWKEPFWSNGETVQTTHSFYHACPSCSTVSFLETSNDC